jgi:hypothetical protein
MAISGDNVIVKMDDSSGTLRTFDDGDIISVDLGLKFDQFDVTGFGDDVHNMINGQLRAPVTLTGYLTTTSTTGTHTVLKDVFAQGKQATLTVQVGQNAAPTAGDPEYSGEFIVSSYVPVLANGGAVTFTAQLVPATGTAPAWGSVS